MKRIILIILLALTTSASYSQTEKASYKTTVETFKANYNTNTIDAIFLMFSEDMKKQVPLDKLTTFLTNLKSQAGSITNLEFIMYEQKTVALYKTTFEHAVYGLNISLDANSKINGLLVKPFKDNRKLPKIKRNKTKLILPFKDEWTVFWGGDTQELNYHVTVEAQKNAFDFLITDSEGKSYKTNGRTNEDYYAFGKALIAPSDGEVVLVVDGVKDNTPGEMNPVYVPGNTVIIKTVNNEYLFFAHFKQHSIQVKQGQKIKQGDLLGLCGNSGNSSEPHLHFHIQNVENMTIATGAKCYFENIMVNGELKTDYSPIKNQKIKNK